MGEVRATFCKPPSTADEQCKGGPLNMPANWTRNGTLTTAAGGALHYVDRDPSNFGVDAWSVTPLRLDMHDPILT